MYFDSISMSACMCVLFYTHNKGFQGQSHIDTFCQNKKTGKAPKQLCILKSCIIIYYYHYHCHHQLSIIIFIIIKLFFPDKDFTFRMDKSLFNSRNMVGDFDMFSWRCFEDILFSYTGSTGQ